MSKNLFPNQFNIALNLDAAKSVLSKYQQFYKFAIVPTDTTKCVTYSLDALEEVAPGLGKRCLAFNCRVDPMKLATGEITLAKFTRETYTMPDLTSFLCAFSPGFGGSVLEHASLVDLGGGRLIVVEHPTGIPVYVMRQQVELRKGDALRVVSTLVLAQGG